MSAKALCPRLVERYSSTQKPEVLVSALCNFSFGGCSRGSGYLHHRQRNMPLYFVSVLERRKHTKPWCASYLISQGVHRSISGSSLACHLGCVHSTVCPLTRAIPHFEGVFTSSLCSRLSRNRYALPSCKTCLWKGRRPA